MAQEGSKYQEMIRAQTIEGIENDNSGQDVNRIQINGEDDEQQSRTKDDVRSVIVVVSS